MAKNDLFEELVKGALATLVAEQQNILKSDSDTFEKIVEKEIQDIIQHHPELAAHRGHLRSELRAGLSEAAAVYEEEREIAEETSAIEIPSSVLSGLDGLVCSNIAPIMPTAASVGAVAKSRSSTVRGGGKGPQ